MRSLIKPLLLVIGGVVQVLIAAPHTAMFFGISKAGMPDSFREIAQIFNAAVLTLVLFFAYV